MPRWQLSDIGDYSQRAGSSDRLSQRCQIRHDTAEPGWLRAVRDAIGLSQATMGKKLHIKRQSYAQSEAAEERGAISLTSLQRAAEAMDCELVYFIVPREGVASTYTELAQIHDPGFKHLRAVEHSMALEGQGITDYQKTKLAWRYASSADLGLLAEWNHQLIRDEGHRNPMTVEQLAGGWRNGCEANIRR